ncbi:MAG: glutamine synthetase family protein [Rubrivivax sp.]
MSSFAERCGQHDAARAAACEQVLRAVHEQRLQRVRVAWCDLHGALRGKTLTPAALPAALADGIGLVGTLLLKDTSDRTAFRVFDPALQARLPGFAGASNLQLLPDPHSFAVLPWAEGTGWLRGQPWFTDATPVPQDSRRVLQRALRALHDAGYGLRCGLEVEFHIYRITDDRVDPRQAAWPGEPPALALLHPGYNLLAEAWADLADEALTVVHRTADGLGLPLRSLEIELGPSQVEAVFGVMDALDAADAMVRFRSGVRQALRRAGYYASFVCRPPFPHVMASGWHLHQSLVRRADGANAFTDAAAPLSATGRHYLAGLLAHARGATVLGTPTINGFGRFRPHALAPMAARWGHDNRGAMLRVIGAPGDAAARIENRIGEPAANPYLYLASQVIAGLDGLQRALVPPPPTDDPYADVVDGAPDRLPATLTEGLQALQDDAVLVEGLGAAFVDVFVEAKRSEIARHAAAEDPAAWERREYFSRV